MLRKILSILLAATIISGCVPYPVLKTLQPSARVVLLDELNNPVPGASVALISTSYPNGFEKSRDTQITAIDGTARFESRREFRVEAIAMHGSEVFFWNWCIQKEGFKTIETAFNGATGFERDLTVVLRAGTSVPCRKGMRLKAAQHDF
ncbi:carboxypeptidase regulatory-like domain-containing protein [Duganella sp. FT92W]|uniref:Carboxypeptidase regulatory-like domain-containing protein n=1 Tax=Pseudoduganella rivuli TaxID=2666085 RepID=A0A7X2LPG4_9BURK|nr:carboxypeptidase regulatory-like domain-containing protein [Pseudoduganella rivuli]MRV70215.1 carboxypeptidase regulatory-like domain-containing protein [Pseudoduganella rivuli]